MTCLSRAVGALTLIATSLVAQNIGGAIQQPSTGSGSSGLTIGTTTISGGCTGCILYGDGTNLQNATGVTRTAAGTLTFATGVVSPLYTGVAAISFRPGADSTTAMQFGNAAGSAFVTLDSSNSRVGIGIAPTTDLLEVGTFNTSGSNLRVASLEVQPFALNNTFIGENVFYNGTNFTYRATGFSGILYFEGQEGQFRFSPSGTGGTTVGQTTAQLKINQNGTVAIGGQINNSVNVYTGAAAIVFGGTSNFVIGGVTDGNYRLDIQKSGSSGTARFFDQTATTGATRVLISLGAADSATTPTLTNAGTTKSGGYQSSDGTAGVSQTCTILSITSFVVKNGLIVSCS